MDVGGWANRVVDAALSGGTLTIGDETPEESDGGLKVAVFPSPHETNTSGR